MLNMREKSEMQSHSPTEPATSPRLIDPTREIGPRPEPEVYPIRYIVNVMTQ